MSTGSILKHLREKADLTQQDVADRIHVTRQAVSRWENDETIPSSDLLVALSGLFQVSTDSLLESPVIRYCECCGMPIDPSIMGIDRNGEINPRYCKWCLDDGRFVYTDLNQMLEYLVNHLPIEGMDSDQCREFYCKHLIKLPYWKQKMESEARGLTNSGNSL